MTTWFRGWLLGNSHFTTADKAERRLAARTDGQKESPHRDAGKGMLTKYKGGLIMANKTTQSKSEWFWTRMLTVSLDLGLPLSWCNFCSRKMCAAVGGRR